MKRSYLLGAVCASIFTLGLATPVDAALVSKLGGQVVYDMDRDITWIANANLALTNQFGLTLSGSEIDDTANTVGSTGKMTGDNALAWIAGMNAANYLGFNDWALPTTLDPDSSCTGDPFGYNCSGSEMGHLFYGELSGTAGSSILASGDTDLTLFSNLQSDTYYSGTPAGTVALFTFGFQDGLQGSAVKGNNFFALAVRAGDIGAVPIPAAVWLFGSGLLGLIGFAKRKKT